MKKYKVIGFKAKNYSRQVTSFHIKEAQDLQHKYGLIMFTIDDIIRIWEEYSTDFYCAGWLIDSPDTVEQAFGVILEEVP